MTSWNCPLLQVWNVLPLQRDALPWHAPELGAPASAGEQGCIPLGMVPLLRLHA
jgi:hypothetical protein